MLAQCWIDDSYWQKGWGGNEPITASRVKIHGGNGMGGGGGLYISVQVGVETGPPQPRGLQFHQGWHIGVVRREEEVEVEAPARVGRVLRSCDPQ